MTLLKKVWLHLNTFSGPLPDFSSFTDLRSLSLRDNLFTGPVPVSLVSLKSLEVVNLTNNLLQGPMPAFVPGVGVDLVKGSNNFCLPSPGECDHRVNMLLSIKMGLAGTISPEIVSIRSLQRVVLADNNLTGTIPAELATLPALTIFDVSNNYLYRKTPTFKDKVLVMFGNPDIGKEKSTSAGPSQNSTNPSTSIGSGNSSKPHGKKSSTLIGVIVFSVIGGVFVILLIVLLLICFSVSVDALSEAHTLPNSEPNEIQMVEAGNMVISIQVLRNVTNNFSQENILGQRGFGTVYKGERHDGTNIAVKRIEAGEIVGKGLFEFKSEISILTKSFIHRDLKPSNILLGDDMRAKVADFGLMRLAPEGKGSIETRIVGTFGYLAPEYAVTGRVITKVDMFSFGVILMELITGKKAFDDSWPEESMHLVTWFRKMFINKDSFRKMIDPTIDLNEETLANVSTVAELADLEMSLPQALKKWQAFESRSNLESSSSSLFPSLDNTQTSILTRPYGFAESFTSADGR
ncbi:hypothetical protein TB2_047092 [Malus domestica]